MTDPAPIGHNSGGDLKVFLERIERLEAEKSETAEDIKEIYLEAKSSGFDVKTIRAIVRMRKQDAKKREQQEALLELYLQQLGML